MNYNNNRRRNRNLPRLIESLFLLEKPEAKKDDIFGRYLFAPQREDLADKEKKEDNTSDEESLFYALRRWYENAPSSLRSMFDTIEDEIEKGNYKGILAPPEGAPAYRFINNVSLSDAASILGMDEEEIIESNGEPTIASSPGFLPPYSSDLQSWTLSGDYDGISKILDTTDNTHLIQDCVAIVMQADVDDADFIINPNGIQNVKGLPSFAYEENETISYGDVPLSKAAFIYNPEDADEVLSLHDVIYDLVSLIEE